jgi:hypothetical protein
MSRAVVWTITCACVLVSSSSCATSRASDLRVRDLRAVATFDRLATEMPNTFRSLRPGVVRGALSAAQRIDPTGALELQMHEALVARRRQRRSRCCARSSGVGLGSFTMGR